MVVADDAECMRWRNSKAKEDVEGNFIFLFSFNRLTAIPIYSKYVLFVVTLHKNEVFYYGFLHSMLPNP